MTIQPSVDIITPEQIAAIDRVRPRVDGSPLTRPPFIPGSGQTRVMLALETFRRHMTNEGWQLQKGLESAGYELWGAFLSNNLADAAEIAKRTNPHTVVVQDKREWDPSRDGCFDKRVAFSNLEALADRVDVFRVTILKDAHQDPDYTRQGHEEITPHAWITYYHPAIVTYLCPWVRPEHVIRTYHSVDPMEVPSYTTEARNGCLLSGAMGGDYYPLRQRLLNSLSVTPSIDCLAHPGYHARGHATPAYLETLGRYKVAICTSSVLKYALRKIIEATACGCVVITDLPATDKLPEIDGNLVRVPDAITPQGMDEVVRRELADYDSGKQRMWATKAVSFYDYHRQGRELADTIEQMRIGYAA